MTSRRLTALVMAVAFATTALAACGDDEDQTAAPPPAATQPAETQPSGDQQPRSGEPVQVAAEPSGDLAYVQDSLSAQAGSITFEFTNQSTVPHDFNIEQDGEDIEGTQVITQDQTTLMVELEPGRYTYYCSVANHREAGMEGPLTVE